MANLFAKYETDPSKELNGIVVKVDDAEFIIRCAGGHNRGYRFALSEAAKPYREKLSSENINDIDKAILVEEFEMIAFSNSIIINWNNLEDRDGQPMPFSPAAAYDLLKSCPRVWEQLKAAAIDDDNFRLQGKQLGE